MEREVVEMAVVVEGGVRNIYRAEGFGAGSEAWL